MSDLKSLIEQSSLIELAVLDGRDDVPFEVDLNNVASVEAYNFITQNLEQRAEFYKAQAAEFSKIAKNISNLSERYNEHVKKIMAESGLTDIEGTSFRFKLTTVKPKMVIDNEELLIADYSKTETKVVIDKERAKQDLELGVPVKGAHLEQSYSLRRYPIKGLK